MFDRLIHRWAGVPYTLNVHTHHKPDKYTSTVVFLHGIGNSGAAWEKVIARLPENIRVISIDLLGFGTSPRPTWAVYNVKTQARSVIATLLRLKLNGRVVLVGHSLGSLVSVEVTKRYPLLIKSLVLCSPPFYDESTDKNVLLRTAYERVEKNPDQFIKFASLAMRYKLVNKSFKVTSDNIQPYLATFRASILSQTSLRDAKRLKKPIVMILGVADPWVKKRNLNAIVKINPRASLRMVVAAHEIRGLYVDEVVEAIKQTVIVKPNQLV